MGSIAENTIKVIVSQTLGYTARNPAEALFFSIAVANPKTRGLAIEVGLHMGKQMVVDISFYSRLVGRRMILPAAKKIGWTPVILASIYTAPFTTKIDERPALGRNLIEYQLLRPSIFDVLWYWMTGNEPQPRPYAEHYDPSS